MLHKHENLEYFAQANDTDSIVSFRVRNQSGESEWLKKEELVKVFRAMTLDRSDLSSDKVAGLKCFIGQPVKISSDYGVLRIALGSDSLRQYIDDPEATLADDLKIVEKLSVLSHNYHKL